MNQMSRIEGEASPEEAIAIGEGAAPPVRRRVGRLVALLGVPLLILAAGVYFWMTGGKTVSTENAQVNVHVVSVAPEVSGRIVEVAVSENQQVKAGDLLYRIDPAPYRIAVMQAEAAVGNARLQISQMESGYSAKVADIGTRSSTVALATENFRRQEALLGRGFTTRAAYDSARAALLAARSEQASASAEAQSARALLGTPSGGHPQVQAAEAALEKARLDLARTTVRAPIAGIVSQTDRLTPGAMATQMLGNVSIVGGGGYWVEANFKETQLAKIRVGQPAEIEIDAVPNRTFAAHVSSIGVGTGSEFSLLPAQNATGNWVKITQRVPVRLTLDRDPGITLVTGWSAHVTVRVAN